MFGQDRNQMRQYFYNVWHKANGANQPPLEPLEKLVAGVIEQHPEYHSMLTHPTRMLEQEFLPENGHSNPFLHMGMHIAIQEQLSSQRPAGINKIWTALAKRHNSPHEGEHLMMECLAEMLWQAQREQREPDETGYIKKLNDLLGK